MSLRTDLQDVSARSKRGELLYRDAQYLSATMEIADPAAARAFLPAGLSLAKPYRADLFLAYFPDSPFTAGYLEAGLFLHVKTMQGTGVHCPWMLVDDGAALILGREITGYPKKLAEFMWEHTDDVIRAAASRRGTKLVEMTARLGAPISNPPPFLGRPHRNIAGVMGVGTPAVVAFTPKETAIEVREVELELSFCGTEFDPIDCFGLGAVEYARLHRVNLGGAAIPPIPIRPVSPLFLTRNLNLRAF